MFNGKCTLFILGAGASVDFGFPTGNILREELRRMYPDMHIKSLSESVTRGKEIVHSDYRSFKAGGTKSISSSILQTLEAVYALEPELSDFYDKFNNSPVYSIDEWLVNWPKLREVGCLILAYHILKAEANSKVFRTETWAQYLMGLCGNTKEQFEETEFLVMTFNYDRSFEHFLYLTLLNKYAYDPQKAKKIVKDKVIHHIHGKLGALEWEEASEAEVIKYGEYRVPFDQLRAAANRIKVVHETDHSDDLSQRARALIDWADNVVFLGFAYYRENLKKLKISEQSEYDPLDKFKVKTGKTFHGTCLGIEGTKRSQLESNYHQINFYDRSALDLLKYEDIL